MEVPWNGSQTRNSLAVNSYQIDVLLAPDRGARRAKKVSLERGLKKLRAKKVSLERSTRLAEQRDVTDSVS